MAPAWMPLATLHHAMGRGIERRAIFRDGRDRADSVRRLAAAAEGGTWQVYAWALLPNHAHLLVRTGTRPLARTMRSVLTGYAGTFNRRHRRAGHLFQNRYKSIVVEEEPYLLELVRYLHLNPLRAGLVKDLRGLDRYAWGGHAALVGTRDAPWQATHEVLGRFARSLARARAAYRAFVAAGAGQGRRPDLQGGGLLRSAGGWAAVRALRRGREAYQADERILGSGDFVARILRQVEAAQARPAVSRTLELPRLIRAVGDALGLSPAAFRGGGRRPILAEVRAGIAYLWVGYLGRSGRALAPALGIQPAAVYKAVRRGEATAAHWRRVLGARE